MADNYSLAGQDHPPGRLAPENRPSQRGDLVSPAARQVQLDRPPDPGIAADSFHLLYPLALYELERQELFLYGGSHQRTNEVAYVGSMSGEHPRDVDAADQLQLLRQLLGRDVTDENLNAWRGVPRAERTVISIPPRCSTLITVGRLVNSS